MPSTNRRSCSSTGETFTWIAAGTPSVQPHVCASRQACCNTERPIATTAPVSSASGMNDDGIEQPRGPSGHRTSASQAVTRPVSSSTIGW